MPASADRNPSSRDTINSTRPNSRGPAHRNTLSEFREQNVYRQAT
jgi:hypothetical protein